MKKIMYAVAASLAVMSCKTQQADVSPPDQPVVASIDLVNVQNDKIKVTVDPDRFTTEQTTFYIPKTVPGTYSTADYGRFVDDFKAYDYKGNELKFERRDDNSWVIPDAEKLDKVSYWVNDTFDMEGEGDIYSMAGTNILEDRNFLLNLQGFVGYFQNMTEKNYRLEVLRPQDLFGATALRLSETVPSAESTTDVYRLNRYFEVTDNPIMYSAPDTVSFNVQGMEVLLSVYSPSNKFSAQSFRPTMEKMITAQKNFLGDIDDTNKYAILLYLSSSTGEGDAGNFGALEHHSSTVVVMPESMGQGALNENLTNIVSHEFFHIVTPLGVHSKEVHFFDYNDPKMSQHLWMYEGVTEYFAHLFQVNQGLIDNQAFYDRINEKINTSKNFDDTMPFTVMSKNILEDEYKDSYYNVYLKGALIGMALDLRLRELSEGEMGLLDLMKKLTDKYGKNKPFEDEELIPVIVDMTYPEIQEFFDTYVSGTTPIPYSEYFQKVGLEMKEDRIPVSYFIKDQTLPYVDVTQQGEIVVRSDIELNSFLKDVGLQPGDIIRSINGTAYNVQNIYELITTSMGWSKGEDIEIVISRNSEEMTLKSKVTEPTATGMRLVEKQNADSDQIELRHAWLKS